MRDDRSFRVFVLSRQIKYLHSIAVDESRLMHERDKAARDLIPVQNALMRARGIKVSDD